MRRCPRCHRLRSHRCHQRRPGHRCRHCRQRPWSHCHRSRRNRRCRRPSRFDRSADSKHPCRR
ncbi:MAG: hypothetical protein FJ286_13940 [Planctomycetes bacterium]|nr:hypothetical protein [Planctomycetota bacterium]